MSIISTTPHTIEESLGYRDTSTECGICLCAYEDPAASDDEDKKTTIELSCGHKWHLECIREQLARAQPSPSKRLVFQGCRCAKCGVVCHHPALRDVLRSTDRLRPKVDRLLAEHLQLANSSSSRTFSTSSSSSSSSLVESVRHKYAFYLCLACHEPYLAGTVNCKGQESGDSHNVSSNRLCPACCHQQQGHLTVHSSTIYKCRYCCHPASRLCSDSVHMCEACHERSIHLHDHAGYHELTAIPCPGGDKCPWPKPQENNFHSNGPYASCEQVYSSVGDCCDSDNETLDNPRSHSPASANLLINPSGKQGFHGWRRLNINESWQVESSPTPLNNKVNTNFVSTHFWCSMEQTVDLTQVTADPDNECVQVSAQFMGHENVPSVFRLSAEILDASGHVQRKMSTRILSAPADFWQVASLVLEPTPKARFVKITLHGKDGVLMRGHYGTKVTDCSVRILGDDDSNQ